LPRESYVLGPPLARQVSLADMYSC
jgi:hypothetical protein